MLVELKNVKHFAAGSHETECFTAILYINRAIAGSVSNEGVGGPNMIHFTDHSLVKPFREYVRSLPPIETTVGLLPYDEDLLIGDLLLKHLTRKRLSRHLKRETIFRLKGDREGEYRTIKSPFNPDVKKHLTDKYGDKLEEIANEVYA